MCVCVAVARYALDLNVGSHFSLKISIKKTLKENFKYYFLDYNGFLVKL